MGDEQFSMYIQKGSRTKGGEKKLPAGLIVKKKKN